MFSAFSSVLSFVQCVHVLGLFISPQLCCLGQRIVQLRDLSCERGNLFLKLRLCCLKGLKLSVQGHDLVHVGVTCGFSLTQRSVTEALLRGLLRCLSDQAFNDVLDQLLHLQERIG